MRNIINTERKRKLDKDWIPGKYQKRWKAAISTRAKITFNIKNS